MRIVGNDIIKTDVRSAVPRHGKSATCIDMFRHKSSARTHVTRMCWTRVLDSPRRNKVKIASSSSSSIIENIAWPRILINLDTIITIVTFRTVLCLQRTSVVFFSLLTHTHTHTHRTCKVKFENFSYVLIDGASPRIRRHGRVFSVWKHG